MASQSTMDKLHDMRLSVMARAYRDQEELPAASGLSFDERLAMIVDAEWDSRRTNKRLRHLRQAGFPEQDANIADVRYDDDRKLDRAQMVELSNCSWIASRRNIIVTGASGAGKTWISNALGVAACNAFYTVRYTRLPELLDELTVFKDEELSIAASSGGDSAMRQCANPLAIGARLRRQSGWESFCSQPFFELSVARLPRSSR